MEAVCFLLNKLKPAALDSLGLDLGGCWAAMRSDSAAVALALVFLLGPSMLNNVVNSEDGKINRQHSVRRLCCAVPVGNIFTYGTAQK